jgi:hypothetical protein
MRRLPRTLRVMMRDIAWRPERFTRAECCHAKGAMTSGAGRKRRSSCRRRDLRLATYDPGGMGHHGPGRGGGSLWSRGLSPPPQQGPRPSMRTEARSCRGPGRQVGKRGAGGGGELIYRFQLLGGSIPTLLSLGHVRTDEPVFLD